MGEGPVKYEYLDLYANYYYLSKHISPEEMDDHQREITELVNAKNKITRTGRPGDRIPKKILNAVNKNRASAPMAI